MLVSKQKIDSDITRRNRKISSTNFTSKKCLLPKENAKFNVDNQNRNINCRHGILGVCISGL